MVQGEPEEIPRLLAIEPFDQLARDARQDEDAPGVDPPARIRPRRADREILSAVLVHVVHVRQTETESIGLSEVQIDRPHEEVLRPVREDRPDLRPVAEDAERAAGVDLPHEVRAEVAERISRFRVTEGAAPERADVVHRADTREAGNGADPMG